MGSNPHANGGILLRDLRMPEFRDYAANVPSPGAPGIGDTRVLGPFLRDVMKLNLTSSNFRLFGPDETLSNRLNAIFEAVVARNLRDAQAVVAQHARAAPCLGAAMGVPSLENETTCSNKTSFPNFAAPRAGRAVSPKAPKSGAPPAAVTASAPEPPCDARSHRNPARRATPV